MKTLQKKIEPYQNFTSFYKKGLKTLDELQNMQSKTKTQKVKI